jgi:hypothetical protein
MILYYANAQGSGHMNYARQFASSVPNETIVASSKRYSNPEINYVQLPDDAVVNSNPKTTRCEESQFLHYTPTGIRNITERCKILIDQILEHRVRLVMVDVSVEVATLCRLASVPYAYRRMPGNRWDSAHMEAYRCALFLYAYYPQEFESPETPDWVVDKTLYAGFITDKTYNCKKSNNSSYDELIVIQGSGGQSIYPEDLMHLHQQLPDKRIVTLGKPHFEKLGSWHEPKGFVKDISPHISNRSLVIASCGSNMVSELMSMCKRFIAIPEERPFQEQEAICNRLEELELAVRYQPGKIKENINKLLNLDAELPRFTEPFTMNQFSLALHHYCYNPSSVLKNTKAIINSHKSRFKIH